MNPAALALLTFGMGIVVGFPLGYFVCYRTIQRRR